MECKHEYIIKDGFSQNHALKITLCRFCCDIKEVVAKGEKVVKNQDLIWAEKDERMARMSAIKSAVELLKEGVMHITKPITMNDVFKVANEMVTYIYKKEMI